MPKCPHYVPASRDGPLTTRKNANESIFKFFKTKKNFFGTQIKIWFQNRRTKWKRKYTNDLEMLAQQYYQSLGILAPRPLFIGDRLWYVDTPLDVSIV